MEHGPSPIALIGVWRLDRTVDDRRAGSRYRVTGETVLARIDDDHVRWTESGTMTGPGIATPVSRVLDVVRDRDAWTVRFADGRDFHPWAVGEDVVHDCAPDVYRGRIDVTDDAWTVVWDAIGPEKDYRMESMLSRPTRSPMP